MKHNIGPFGRMVIGKRGFLVLYEEDCVTIRNTIAGEETVHKLASLLLVFLGGSYIILILMGKGSHGHTHNQPMEKMAVAGLILGPAPSPCATTLPVFLAVGNSYSIMVIAIIVLLLSSLISPFQIITIHHRQTGTV
ncbi:hypothetical protein DCAR_0519548 [Daucus carota subsp. sativus]|uniref:Uncharacterized protein n=1 Tax=Daucus carota subsp. sativus TaxID=79200 RepID=A0AAF0X2X9_DAUCS|nr:PREDICTED: uncharacterized protein LOC108221322 [Daucus carota subsp. sativus]WOH00190.1 hypothetical protein DCAR_0519548 [Daucus carota subsp. sativus]